jgi:hypothetical protein
MILAEETSPPRHRNTKDSLPFFALLKTSSVTLDFIGFDFEIGCPVELTFHTFHLSLFSFQF